MNANQNKGKFGESFALGMLESQGYLIIRRNFRCRLGEIDIIAEKNGWIHFVEVKTRTSRQFGHAEESITEVKRRKIKKTAEYFLNQYEGKWKGMSFDAFVIETSFIENCF